MKRSLILAAWAIMRLLFLAFWSFAHPIGVANVWLANQWKAVA